MLDGLHDVMVGWIMVMVSWRIVCLLFRKRGTCKFRECPFRRRYAACPCIYFPSGGCTKCPPTKEERAVYERTPDGIIEYLVDDKEVS